MTTSPRPPIPEHTRWAGGGMVCSVDHLASAAGVTMLGAGGSAADAAVAASAVLAVTTQHMCGMGGDLWALVHGPGEAVDGVPRVLNASGRAGSGSDATAMRAEGHTVMPFRSDLRSVPVPGCVDGWVALHEAYGRLSFSRVLAPAAAIADRGYAVGPLQALMLPAVAGLEGADDYRRAGRPAATGEIVRRPAVAQALRDIGERGRSAWYEGDFGRGLRRLGEGLGAAGGPLYDAADLARVNADWVDPVTTEAWGHHLWTVPPNSQGYLSVAAAAIADGLPMGTDPTDGAWAHFLIEAAKQAAWDRPDVLHEHADGAALVAAERLAERRAAIDPDRASTLRPPASGGGTIYLCAVDADRMGVSLMQSNASGFGVHLTVPEVGVFLQNRGIGFSLAEGHPAELGPGRRPPSTLAPALVTRPDGSLRTVLGTMGGDGQPQVVLQMLARLLQAEQDPGSVLSNGRFTLTVPDAAGFDTWARRDELLVAYEDDQQWGPGLMARGHRVRADRWGATLFGHAHLIDVRPDGHLEGATDPRARIGAALGWL